MARVTVEDCTIHIPDRFKLVALASKRAKDISAGSRILVERDNDKNAVIALREIASEKVKPEALERNFIDSHRRSLRNTEAMPVNYVELSQEDSDAIAQEVQSLNSVEEITEDGFEAYDSEEDIDD